MNSTSPKKVTLILNAQASTHRAPSIMHKPRHMRSYFDVGIGSVCLSGEDTCGAYCLLEASLAPGMGVPRQGGQE
jgi:hypothetical protein